MHTEWRLVNKLHPEIAKDITRKVTPTLTNIDQIPTIYSQFQQHSQDELLFVALILKLYCPGVFLIHDKKTNYGIVKQLQEVLNFDNRIKISRLVSQAKTYMRVPAYAQKVEEIRKEVWK